MYRGFRPVRRFEHIAARGAIGTARSNRNGCAGAEGRSAGDVEASASETSGGFEDLELDVDDELLDLFAVFEHVWRREVLLQRSQRNPLLDDDHRLGP